MGSTARLYAVRNKNGTLAAVSASAMGKDSSLPRLTSRNVYSVPFHRNNAGTFFSLTFPVPGGASGAPLLARSTLRP
jgi:hypothetical protein